MDNEGNDVSFGRLAALSDEDLHREKEALFARLNQLYGLKNIYNDEVRKALDSTTDQDQRLANAQHWSAMRDQADAMAQEIRKKQLGCLIEEDLRAGIGK